MEEKIQTKEYLEILDKLIEAEQELTAITLDTFIHNPDVFSKAQTVYQLNRLKKQYEKEYFEKNKGENIYE